MSLFVHVYTPTTHASHIAWAFCACQFPCPICIFAVWGKERIGRDTDHHAWLIHALSIFVGWWVCLVLSNTTLPPPSRPLTWTWVSSTLPIANGVRVSCDWSFCSGMCCSGCCCCWAGECCVCRSHCWITARSTVSFETRGWRLGAWWRCWFFPQPSACNSFSKGGRGGKKGEGVCYACGFVW